MNLEAFDRQIEALIATAKEVGFANGKTAAAELALKYGHDNLALLILAIPMPTVNVEVVGTVVPDNLLTAAARHAAGIDALPEGWQAWDVSKGIPSLYSENFASYTQVMFKDRTKETCKAGFDWLADRGDNPIIAYFDEIPF